VNVGLFLKIEGCDWGSSCIWVNTAFEPKKDDLTNHLQVLNNEKLCDIYRSTSTARIVNSGCGRPQCGQACCVCVCVYVGTRNAFKISIGALFENVHLGNKEEVRG